MQLSFTDPERSPEIYINGGRKDLGDHPSLHRWRAGWGWGPYDKCLPSIVLTAYPVFRVTPKGAWVAEDPWDATYCVDEHGTPGWVIHGTKRRWVSNDGGAAWAKPTKEDAMRSLAVRLSRWVRHIRSDATKASQALKSLEVLREGEDLREKTLIRYNLDSLREGW